MKSTNHNKLSQYLLNFPLTRRCLQALKVFNLGQFCESIQAVASLNVRSRKLWYVLERENLV
jgi:hypothetical protein